MEACDNTMAELERWKRMAIAADGAHYEAREEVLGLRESCHALVEERETWKRRALAAEATVNDVIEALGAQEDVDAGRAIADAAKGERDGRNMAIDTMLKRERERDEARAEVAKLRAALKAVVACHSWPSAIIIAGEAIAKGGAT